IGASGVWGDSNTGHGVIGTSSALYGSGVIGKANNIGVYGNNPTGGVGVYGDSVSGTGVYGICTSGNGVYGQSSTGAGVRGVSLGGLNTLAGVIGESHVYAGTALAGV